MRLSSLLSLIALTAGSGCTVFASLGSCGGAEDTGLPAPPSGTGANADSDGWWIPDDCNDANPAVNPAATEGPDGDPTCTDGQDNDCDSALDTADDGCAPDTAAPADTAWMYDDADGDTYSEAEGDCDDNADYIYPEAPDSTGDGEDWDCDGAELCFEDADDDGYRPDSETDTPSSDLDCSGPGEAWEDEPIGDCDDTRSDIHPGLDELCDDLNADEDCDGAADDDDLDEDGDDAAEPLGRTWWYADRDDDTYGDNYTAEERCDPREHFIADNQDCDDSDASITLPLRWAPDSDNDGWGTTVESTWLTQCEAAVGYTSEEYAQDCDDASSAWNPGVVDACMDGFNQDCTGEADDDSWSWWSTFYAYAGHDDEVTTAGSDPIYLTTGDLDGDFAPDLVVVGNSSGRVYAFLNDTTGEFYLESTYDLGSSARSAAVAPIKSLGRDSIIAVNPEEDIATTLYLHDGVLEDMDSVDLPSGSASAVALIDLSGDDRAETALIGDSDGCGIHFYAVSDAEGSEGTLSFTATSELDTVCSGSGPVQIHKVESVDSTSVFSANANMDSFSMFAWESSGWALKGTWDNSSMGLSGALSQVSSVTTGDFGGGTDYDVAAVSLSSTAMVLANASALYLSATTIDLGSGTQPESVVAGDYSGDGLDDLAVVLSAVDQVVVYVQTGDFTFARRATLTVGDDPTEMVTEDFDGDGDLDLAVTNLGDNAITVLKNNCVP